MFFCAVLIVPGMWLGRTIQAVQKRQLTIHSAYIGLILTGTLVVLGIVFFMKAVAQLTGHWEDVFRLESDRMFGVLYGLLGLIHLLLASLAGGLAIQCYNHVVHGESVPYFERLQALYEPDESARKKEEARARWAGRLIVTNAIGFVILYDAIAFLDHSFLIAMLIYPAKQLDPIFPLMTLVTFPLVFLVLGTAAVAVVYVVLVIVSGIWGPPRQPWFVYPPAFNPTDMSRFVARVYNWFPLRRRLEHAFWLLVLVASLGLSVYEMYARLSSGDWPRFSGDKFGDANTTGLLALGVFYALVSARRLARLHRDRETGGPATEGV
jgi:hypothetical protein